MEYISKIKHINCSPDFLEDKKNVEALEALCKAAFHMKTKENLLGGGIQPTTNKMELKQYQKAAVRTLAVLDTDQKNSLHMVLGLATEVGELADAHKRELAYNKPIDKVNTKEEIGDIIWYLVNYCTLNSIDIEDAMQKNIEKLYVRFPEKFDNDKALVRDLGLERKALES